MMRPKYILVIFLFTIGFLSCKNQIEITESTIHIRLKKDPDKLHPLIFPNPVSREIYQYIHVPLADYNPKTLALEPVLIKEMPIEKAIDSGTYAGGVAFELEFKNEAKWDDGSPITVKDYLFTMKVINLPMTDAGNYRDFTSNIKDIVPDPSNDRKFTVIFGHAYLLSLEAAVNIPLYPKYIYDHLNVLDDYDFKDITDENKEQLQKDVKLVQFAETFNSAAFSREIVSGAGPYKLVSWTADQNIVLEKKADYWADDIDIAELQQGPDKMIFHIIPDEVTAIAQLRNGGLDVINELSAKAYSELENDPVLKEKFDFFHPALIKQYYILLNNSDEILKDRNVRKALAHLLDVNGIIKNFEEGKATRTTGPIHPLKKTNNTDLLPINYDLDSARVLLYNAGWEDSNLDGKLDKNIKGKLINLEIEILITGQELGKNIALLLQENARKVGMDIKITEKDMKLIRAENVRTRKFQLIPSILSQDLQKWDDLSRWVSTNNTPDGGNEISYSNQEVDALINKIPLTHDEVERIAIYKEIQYHIYQDQACIFLYAPEERMVVSKSWKASATAKRPGYLANTFTFAGVGIVK